MIWLASVLLVLGVVDLVRWSPEPVPAGRTRVALGAGAVTAVALGLLAVDVAEAPVAALAVVVVGLVAAVAWVGADAPGLRAAGRTPLAVGAAGAALALLAAPLAPPVAGAFRGWFEGLGLPGLAGVGAQTALTALAGAAFLLATANRVVRLVLSSAGTPPVSGEAALRGGRLLGPLERTFILALALAGDLTAAAVVIAAKGVLRLPEIRSARAERRGGADVVTEYFLVGTFTSWLLAVAVAGLVRLTG